MSGFVAFLSAKFVEVVVPFIGTVAIAVKDLIIAAGMSLLTGIMTAMINKYSPVTI